MFKEILAELKDIPIRVNDYKPNQVKDNIKTVKQSEIQKQKFAKGLDTLAGDIAKTQPKTKSATATPSKSSNISKIINVLQSYTNSGAGDKRDISDSGYKELNDYIKILIDLEKRKGE